MEASKHLPVVRKGIGSKGERIQLLANHFRVGMSKNDVYFYHYDVAMSYEDKSPVVNKGIGRKVLDQLCKIYVEMRNISFAYDGQKSLFTLVPLQKQRLQFTVVLDDVSSRRVGRRGSPEQSLEGGDKKRMRRQSRCKTIIVDIKSTTKVPLQAIADALGGQDSENSQEALRVLDIILRQHSANQECLLVRQSFFHDSTSFDVGGGVKCCRGFHSSFRATQGGLSLNIDVSTTMIVKPGPVVDFLLQNQNVKDLTSIDWTKARRMLKNLRIKANGLEFKITGLSNNTCRNEKFLFRSKGANGGEREITVYDYFKDYKMISLTYSADMPCINVGKPKRPCYFPIELCELVSLQRYTKALTNLQRAKLVEKTRQKPLERRKALEDSLRSSRYGDEPMLSSSGITIDPNFTRLEGRILQPPKLIVGRNENIVPRNGRWNFNNKELYCPIKIDRWVIVNFSIACKNYTSNLVELMMRCSKAKGMALNPPFRQVFEEDGNDRNKSAPVRVEKMFEKLKRTLNREPQLLLCILPEKKNCDIYGPWKRKCLVDEGIVTQCIAQTKFNDQYITNVLLKINAKFGGMNSYLTIEREKYIPFVSSAPTLIIGMDVSHGSPGQSNVPSIAAVVSSRNWPQISRYRASVRTQSSKVEMIQSLFKPVPDTNGDEGIIREILLDFSETSNQKPEQIIIFRDGVSESQFNQVLNIELSQIMEACKHLDNKWNPKFTLIVAQKNHHTRFFQTNNARDNVPPGTIVDNTVCHLQKTDFYLCAQAGLIGTTRPTHYVVLHDEIGFSADEVQGLVHDLSYTYQRSTTAVSLVAPICYAHLAAAQMAQFMKFDEYSETSSSHGGVGSAGAPLLPQLPSLHKNVVNTMFFC